MLSKDNQYGIVRNIIIDGPYFMGSLLNVDI